MILNRFEDAVAQKSRMAFYLKKGHKVRITRHPLHCFCPATKKDIEFVGGLSLDDVAKLITNVVR